MTTTVLQKNVASEVYSYQCDEHIGVQQNYENKQPQYKSENHEHSSQTNSVQ